MVLNAYTNFHVGIGWTGVTFGFIALGLRICDFFNLMERLPMYYQKIIATGHTLFGGFYLLCCLFMPITANWIWPRFGTPKEIIYLITSMYLAIVGGISTLRIYKYINNDSDDNYNKITTQELNEKKEKLYSEVTEDVMRDSNGNNNSNNNDNSSTKKKKNLYS